MLAEALVSGADNGVVRGTYVGGKWRKSGREVPESSIAREPSAVSRRLQRSPGKASIRPVCLISTGTPSSSFGIARCNAGVNRSTSTRMQGRPAQSPRAVPTTPGTDISRAL